MIYIMLGINIALLVIGQTLWKYGLSGGNLSLKINDIMKLFTNPYILAGICVYMVATIVWFYILSRAELSMVYPLQSLCYVVAAVVAMLFFKEHIPYTRWFGITLIIVGAYFVSIK